MFARAVVHFTDRKPSPRRPRAGLSVSKMHYSPRKHTITYTYGADVGGAEVDAPKWDARTRSRACGHKLSLRVSACRFGAAHVSARTFWRVHKFAQEMTYLKTTNNRMPKYQVHHRKRRK